MIYLLAEANKLKNCDSAMRSKKMKKALLMKMKNSEDFQMLYSLVQQKKKVELKIKKMRERYQPIHRKKAFLKKRLSQAR